MGIVTISREYGSGGRSVGSKVAEALNYLYINKDLIEEVARDARVPVSEVERLDERPENPALRMLKKLLVSEDKGPDTDLTERELWPDADSLPPPHRDDSLLAEDFYVRLTQEAMLRLSERGNVVIVGRGSHAFLANRFNALHVRIVASMAFRTKTVMKRDGFSEEAAVRQIRKADRQRRRYIKRYYGIAWAAPEHYHLVINTAQTGLATAAGLVVEAARSLSFR